MPWRAQIENPNTNETVGFPTIEELMIFLNERFQSGCERLSP